MNSRQEKSQGNSPALRPNGFPWSIIRKDWQLLSWVYRLTVTAGWLGGTDLNLAGLNF